MYYIFGVFFYFYARWVLFMFVNIGKEGRRTYRVEKCIWKRKGGEPPKKNKRENNEKQQQELPT